MFFIAGTLSASPTDLANFVACRHKTALDLRVAEGRLAKPTWEDPLAKVLRERGDEHERRYVGFLQAAGLSIADLGARPREHRPAETLDAMRAGVDVIVQAALGGDGWFGYADVLRRVNAPSPALGAWSYEAHDTKLSRETRGGTILQLCVYTDLLAAIQQQAPEHFHVITPAGMEPYRFDDFAAFYRQTTSRFSAFVTSSRGAESFATYPEAVEHCGVCRWSSHCNKQRRSDDHLSFVAGLGRSHQVELASHGVTTLAALADTPVPLPFTPTRGAKDTYERLREQARLQARQRVSGLPTFESLPVNPEFGLSQLPEPRPGDLFLDLEGDPFGRPVISAVPGEGGREYLFGLGRVEADGAFTYTARWAMTDAEERVAFDAVMTEIMTALEADPAIHVYHYAAYEPSAFKRLMGRHATREADVDRLLRGRRFVDLYAIVRHALRAGVERYSIKDLEPFYTFARDVELDEAGDQRRIVELALETGDTSLVTPVVIASVEGYNKDDCRSTLELRRWLESLRQSALATGADLPRPPLEPDEPSEKVSLRQQRINALRVRLLDGIPGSMGERTPEHQAMFLLAYLIDWHYREDKVGWWEYYRLTELADEELFDEPAAVAGLAYVERIDVVRNRATGRPTGSVVDRYRYPQQECEIREGAELRLRDETTFGTVMGHDRLARIVDVKKSRHAVDLHPTSAFAHDQVSADQPAGALYRLAEAMLVSGFDAKEHRAAADLLLGRRPRIAGDARSSASESPVDYAVRIAGALEATALPIQGPPGAGKTFTGARMICELVKQGKRVGVTATSHKVIRNLLDAVRKQSSAVRLGHKVNEVSDPPPAHVIEFDDNDAALGAIADRQVDVLGGTAWLWSRETFTNAVDVLFVDEAGQMSLANALAVSQAASSLVLLGDPQQLDQPRKGSHPDGVDASALDHVLQGHKTMPAERGLFLPVTWRLAPAICEFTSEIFYEGKLTSKPGLEAQRLAGVDRFDGAGLFVVDVEHDGCRNASDLEADVVASLVRALLRQGATWIDEYGQSHQMTSADMLVVGPYNAHVARLQERLNPMGVAAGTVDKFQGQEAPVVIYSMATSRPEDAPRGMEFLYSLNRLNVATSRAKCACIVVASPRLFEPECRTPRQMQLANALARLRERATIAGWHSSSG